VTSRVRILGAIAIVAAALGVLAAPAAADPPFFAVSIECETEIGPFAAAGLGQAGEIQQIIPGFNASLRRANVKCLPGTRKITVHKL